MLSDSPPERDLDWTESGIEGAWRYVNRLWRMVSEPDMSLPPAGTPMPANLSDAASRVRAAIHRTIAAVTSDLERFHFNKAVARIRELTNALDDLSSNDTGADWVMREGLEIAARLVGPMMPHLGEEVWQSLDRGGLGGPPGRHAVASGGSRATSRGGSSGRRPGKWKAARHGEPSQGQRPGIGGAGCPRSARGLQGRGKQTIRKVIVVPNRIVNVVL